MEPRKKQQNDKPKKRYTPQKLCTPPLLLDICASHVAENVPFQFIEERYQGRIPGNIETVSSCHSHSFNLKIFIPQNIY